MARCLPSATAAARRFVPLLALVALFCCAPAPGWAAPGAGGTPPQGPAAVRVTDLASLVAGFARDYPDKADVSHSLYLSASASVHVHVLGFEQTAPLHIHRATEEATVVLTGAPRVTLVFGRDGKRATLRQVARPGTLVFSPPFTAHEWVNPDPRRMQANLVFAAPPFDGNFYLKATDPRVLKGGEPLVHDPERALRSLLAAGDPFRIERLPMGGDRLVAVLVRTEATIPAHPVSPTLLYVSHGEGSAEAAGSHPIRPGTLVEVPPGQAVTLRAKPGAPLAVVAFRPET